MTFISRRKILRGAFQGAALSVGIPFLDCFLNSNGNALASGLPIPVRFGTWFWGLGHTPGRGIGEKTGQDYEFLDECLALAPYKNKINYFSNFNTPLDGRPNVVHFTGWVGNRTGSVPDAAGSIPAPSLDVLISDAIGTGTRFRSLEVAATGNPKDSYSARNAGAVNASEVSPIAFYKRIFGTDFVDPANADFTPDPRILARQSVLSAVSEDSRDFVRGLGSADRARMDQYFTSIRQVEQQLATQLEKPAPNAACKVPPSPVDVPGGTEIQAVSANHRILTELMALALACGQTRVFNIVYSQSLSSLHKEGEAATHHTLTHEEPVDATAGYQLESSWFSKHSMEALANFIEIFSSVREGDGTLLDNSLVFASSDTNFAKVHALDGVPVMTIGSAGGRMKTGLHIAGKGDPISRIGLTVQQIIGISVDSWGTRSLATSKPIAELFA
jgi:hypothetical protein